MNKWTDDPWSSGSVLEKNTIQFAKPPRQEQLVQMKREARPIPVVVQDVQVPFLSMVNFMVKWALASIPALLVLFIIGLVCWGALLGPLVEMARHWH